MKYTINLTISGIDPATKKCFYKEREVGSASSLQKAHLAFKEYVESHQFKSSVNYGVFLSIRANGRSVHRMQIN